MAKQKNQLPLILLAIVLLFLVANTQIGNFILYGGVEEPALIEINISGECWTLGQDRCVRQEVNMLNLTTTGLLICPEGWHSIEIDCKRAYGLIQEVRKPKLDCYYVSDDGVCISEQFEEKCPSAGYYQTKSDCEASLIDLGYSAKRLFTDRKTLIFMGIGLVALFFIVVNFLRKR